MVMETRGGFYITQIKQLQDRIFERLLLENGIKVSGGQGRILFILWKTDHLTISQISLKTSRQSGQPPSDDHISHRLREIAAGTV